MIKSLLALSSALFLTTSIFAQGTPMPFTVDGTGKSFKSLQNAVDHIGNGRGTILIRPGTYHQCAVQKGGQIDFLAVIPGQVIFEHEVCEGKAALVLRGQSAKINGIIFQNLGTATGNAAGIMLERGNLDVTRIILRDSDQGILTADDPNGTIRIDQSSFSGLGGCNRDLYCTHGINVGNYRLFTVTKSRFERGNGGHYVISRAMRINLNGNAFDDSRGHSTQYMIDLPGGATGMISDNIFVQGHSKENYSAFIAIAAKGRIYNSTGLSIEGNDASIGTGIERTSAFVANWSGDRVNLGANRLGRKLTPYVQR